MTYDIKSALLTLGAIGRDNAVSAYHVGMALAGNNGDAEKGESDGNGRYAGLRRMVVAALDAGVVVCSSPDGYYLPYTRDEVAQSAESLERRGMALLRRAQTMRRVGGIS